MNKDLYNKHLINLPFKSIQVVLIFLFKPPSLHIKCFRCILSKFIPLVSLSKLSLSQNNLFTTYLHPKYPSSPKKLTHYICLSLTVYPFLYLQSYYLAYSTNHVMHPTWPYVKFFVQASGDFLTPHTFHPHSLLPVLAIPTILHQLYISTALHLRPTWTLEKLWFHSYT